MNETMRLSLTGAEQGRHVIVHCVNAKGYHESGYNLLTMEGSKSYGLRSVTGVSEEGGFVLRGTDKAPKLNWEVSNV